MKTSTWLYGGLGFWGALARRIAAWLVLLVALLPGVPAQVQVSGQPSCPPSRVAGGHDYQGLVPILFT